MLRIGQVSRRARVSIRTLRHYDEIGLLRPAQRSESGYRLYSRGDVERLASILALRSVGMPLEQIREALDDPSQTLASCLTRRLQCLDAEIEARQRARERLKELLGKIDGAADVPLDVLTETLEAIQMFEKYYTPEQLAYLRERREIVGEERIQQVQQERQEVFAGYRDAMEKGLDPSDPAVQALAKKSRELIAEFSGGDAGIEQSLSNMYRAEGPSKVLDGHGCDTDAKLWEYMGRATAVKTD